MNAMRLILALMLPLIGGCASHAPAPVVDRGAPAAEKPKLAVPAALVASDAGSGHHVVKKGETLYGIALDHGLDYKDVAAWNNLENLNLIRVGQQLRITPPDGGAVAVAKPVISSAPVEIRQTAPTASAPAGPAASAASANTEVLKREPKGGKLAWSEDALAKARQADAATRPVEIRPEAKPAEVKAAEPKAPETRAPEKPALSGDDVDWMWPANGRLIAPYAEGGSKGVDIAGKTGDPVLAAADGVVSYAGAGLRGYGNLIVLRHNATFLSVYAHNSKLLVKEKDIVTRGQKIAEMGSTDAESPRLHFEIRRQGKPADPQKFLPAR
ncbi:MAG: peptidoglycan DD-metalloendopeptidase family protein [Sulfuritalea sp.]|jgi:lipoprotein NlpD|nr:peptidoglycan DD-metalloendopeptidase family protein [Sulfuritalea sp.]